MTVTQRKPSKSRDMVSRSSANMFAFFASSWRLGANSRTGPTRSSRDVIHLWNDSGKISSGPWRLRGSSTIGVSGSERNSEMTLCLQGVRCPLGTRIPMCWKLDFGDFETQSRFPRRLKPVFWVFIKKVKKGHTLGGTPWLKSEGVQPMGFPVCQEDPWMCTSTF